VASTIPENIGSVLPAELPKSNLPPDLFSEGNYSPKPQIARRLKKKNPEEKTPGLGLLRIRPILD
jgi:hypothetical protein